MCAARVSTRSMMNLGVALGIGKPLRMNSWLSGWITKAKRRMLRNLPVGCSRRGLDLQLVQDLGEVVVGDSLPAACPARPGSWPRSHWCPPRCRTAWGETSMTRLTLHCLKKARRSSSTAEVMTVLPARLAAVPTAFSSAKVPTMTCELAPPLRRCGLRFLKPDSEAFQHLARLARSWRHFACPWHTAPAAPARSASPVRRSANRASANFRLGV
jgi:hypothetical protein